MVGLAGALVLNIGTLSPPWIEAMKEAGQKARERGIPIVLDPVGAGATRFRTDTAHMLLLQVRPTIVRGNASEIRALFYAEGATKGVDSRHGAEDALDAARSLAEQHACVVSVSGEVDLVVSGSSTLRVANGHPLMPRVTGLGCTATALTGAFAAVNSSPLEAAAHAMAVMGVAGQMAAGKSEGPGSLQMHFLDALHTLGEEHLRRMVQLEQG
jgi:hydroxyethylthiazole kinase